MSTNHEHDPPDSDPSALRVPHSAREKPFDISQISLEEWVAAGQTCGGLPPADPAPAPQPEPPR